jgi:hypothetical protein
MAARKAMAKAAQDAAAPPEGGAQPRRVNLPGFLVEEEVGLGDVIGRATSWAGIAPCGGCAKRAAALNKRVVLGPRSKP